MCNCIKLLPKIITFKNNHSAKFQQVQQHTAHIFLGFGVGAPIVFPHWKQTQMFPGVCWLAGWLVVFHSLPLQSSRIVVYTWFGEGLFMESPTKSTKLQNRCRWNFLEEPIKSLITSVGNESGCMSVVIKPMLTLTKCSTHSLLLMSPCSWTLWPLLCSLITGPGHINLEQAPSSLNPM